MLNPPCHMPHATCILLHHTMFRVSSAVTLEKFFGQLVLFFVLCVQDFNNPP